MGSTTSAAFINFHLKDQNVLETKKKGYYCLKGDATKLDFSENSFSFVVMRHFLEHLSDLDTVEQVIQNSAKIARDFIFIQNPFFDADEYLHELGLKLYWSDWQGHPTHLSTIQLADILKRNGMNKYIFRVRKAIKDSFDPAIHPSASPQDQHEYNYGMHPPKDFTKFKKPVFHEMICYVPLSNMRRWNKVRKAEKGLMKYFQNPIVINPLIRFLNKYTISLLPL